MLIGIAAALCSGCYLVLATVVASGAPIGDVVLFTCAVTLVLAATGAVLGYLAHAKSRALEAELRRVTRAMDSSIRQFDRRTKREAVSAGELNALVARELEEMAARLPRKEGLVEHAEPLPEPTGPNVVAHPASRRQRPAQARQSAEARAEAARIDAFLVGAVASGQIELSLQPIISVEKGQAVGFDVHVHVDAEGAAPMDIRRLGHAVPGLDRAALERLVVTTAAQTARRKLGDTPTPLHVAISEALLRSEAELGAVIALIAQYPLLAGSIVLSLPAELLAGADDAVALELLTGAGVALAAEDWSGPAQGIAGLKHLGTSHMKFPADRLLDRVGQARAGPPAIDLIQAASAAEISLVATDVRNDEDAVSLIDLGVSLMVGDRFSGPRRLKQDGDGPSRPGLGPQQSRALGPNG